MIYSGILLGKPSNRQSPQNRSRKGCYGILFHYQRHLEEEINRISKTKTDLVKKAISNDETFITELSTEKLKEILSLRL